MIHLEQFLKSLHPSWFRQDTFKCSALIPSTSTIIYTWFTVLYIFSSVFGPFCVVWTYSFVSNVALGPHVKENVYFVCLTCCDSSGFRKASQKRKRMLCLISMLRFLLMYLESKGIRWSRYGWAKVKCLLKERHSPQSSCWQQRGWREEKLGANMQSQLPLPQHCLRCLGACSDLSKLGVVAAEGDSMSKGLFLHLEKEALAEQPVSKGSPDHGFVKFSLFSLHDKSVKEIQLKGLSEHCNIQQVGSSSRHKQS